MELSIGIPYLHQQDGRSALCAQVTLPGICEEIWFSVEPEYAAYLTDDRTDAFVVGLLPTAMRLGLDIRCQAPMTKRLKYQLTQYVIPTLSSLPGQYQSIALEAPVTEAPLPSEKAVGAFFTGGVDSMYTLLRHLRPREPGMKLTHLLVANVGSLEGSQTSQTLSHMAERFRGGIAQDLDLKVVSIDSNIQSVCPESFLATLEFRLVSAVLVLQKLFRSVLMASSLAYSQFAFKLHASGFYAPFLLPLLETDATCTHSSGADVLRIEKLEALADFPQAHRNLRPCIYTIPAKNCGRCGKCLRTMTGLYALGVLDRFGDVFDLEDFQQRKEEIMASLLAQSANPFHAEVLDRLARKGEVFSPEIRRKARILHAAQELAWRKSRPDTPGDAEKDASK